MKRMSPVSQTVVFNIKWSNAVDPMVWFASTIYEIW
jgi:hypothetical protein